MFLQTLELKERFEIVSSIWSITNPISKFYYNFITFVYNFQIFGVYFVTRNRKFYGNTLTEAIQAKGETIYIPHLIAHAVYNLDDTVAATAKPYYGTAIDESAFELFVKKQNWFAKDNGSHIFVFDGQ